MNIPSPSSNPSHSVLRSKELLACARTALQIVQKQQQQHQQHERQPSPLNAISPSSLQLYQEPSDHDHHGHHAHHRQPPETSSAVQSVKDSLTLLSHLDTTLSELETLVKRRGHTNDPTADIQVLMKSFERTAEELAEIASSVSTGLHGSGKQRRKHFELVSKHLKEMGEKRVARFKKCMEVRGKVIKGQIERRRKILSPENPKRSDVPLAASSGVRNNGTGRAKAAGGRSYGGGTQMNSPLFTMTGSSLPPKSTNAPSSNNGNGGSYGGSSYPPPSYPSYYNTLQTKDGIRQRRTVAPHQPPVQTQQQQHYQPNYQQQQTAQIHAHNYKDRLSEAQDAERAISELSTVFSKMASLISSQGEDMSKIEDDVEAGLDHITKGGEEIVKLYQITKGNRGLILKIFGVLIFVILFMRLY